MTMSEPDRRESTKRRERAIRDESTKTPERTTHYLKKYLD